MRPRPADDQSAKRRVPDELRRMLAKTDIALEEIERVLAAGASGAPG